MSDYSNDPFVAEILARMYGFHVRAEDKRLDAYKDTKQILTVGIGHNCQARPVPGVTKEGDMISEATCMRLYQEDTARAIADLDHYLPWWRGMGLPRAAVLFDLCFNMGIGYPPPSPTKRGRGLRSFIYTLAHMAKGDYAAAAAGLAQSQWAKDVRSRSVPLIKQMETGQWQI